VAATVTAQKKCAPLVLEAKIPTVSERSDSITSASIRKRRRLVCCRRGNKQYGGGQICSRQGAAASPGFEGATGRRLAPLRQHSIARSRRRVGAGVPRRRSCGGWGSRVELGDEVADNVRWMRNAVRGIAPQGVRLCGHRSGNACQDRDSVSRAIPEGFQIDGHDEPGPSFCQDGRTRATSMVVVDIATEASGSLPMEESVDRRSKMAIDHECTRVLVVFRSRQQLALPARTGVCRA